MGQLTSGLRNLQSDTSVSAGWSGYGQLWMSNSSPPLGKRAPAWGGIASQCVHSDIFIILQFSGFYYLGCWVRLLHCPSLDKTCFTHEAEELHHSVHSVPSLFGVLAVENSVQACGGQGEEGSINQSFEKSSQVTLIYLFQIKNLNFRPFVSNIFSPTPRLQDLLGPLAAQGIALCMLHLGQG